MPTLQSPEPEQLTCMEVWGGSEPTQRAVSISGLDAWVYCLPYNQAQSGGDVYYMSSCATGRITRLLVADVSGHGEAVAELASGLRMLMRRFVNHLHQTRFVKSMNEQFVEQSRDGIFATALVATYFAPTGELSLCNAGHPPPLHYCAKTKTWAYLEKLEPEEAESSSPGNVPLGIIDLVDYEQFETQLEPNDLVLCYTDSLIEARDPSGQMLERPGLIDMIRTLDPAHPEAFIPELIEKIAQRSPGKPWDDDVTAMLFRPNGQGRKVSWPRLLFAERRILSSMITQFFKGGQPMALPDFSLRNLGGAVLSRLNFWKRKQR